MKAPGFISAVAGIALAIASVAPLTANAGIKYWDNPAYRAFDVDCYVPGAVLNFDGIRNAGPTADHDNAATTWKNLGTDGATYDTTPVSKGSGPSGEWTDKGYWFKGGTRWYNASSVSVPTNWTVQILVDADADDLLGSSGPVMSAIGNYFAFWFGKSSGKFYASLNAGKTEPYMLTTTHEYDYATIIVNNGVVPATATMFSGTTPPTSGDGYRTSETGISVASTTGWGLGSSSTDGQQMVGILKYFRWYKRVLTEEELTWNRVVDEQRFFGCNASIPVTNVVVATAVSGAEGTEPSGTYAVDGRHVFTAPATVTVGGIDYVCTGYTTETRDGDGWTEPVFHNAALFQPVRVLVTDTDCVRLTWQWAKADGLNLYTVHDYVWEGLEVFYDGICNQGTNVAHSMTATNWVNLGTKGSMNDMFVQRLNAAGTAWETAANLNTVGIRNPGYWTENGFRIDAEGRFRCNSPGGFNVGTSYSLQMLVDAKASDQVNSNYAYLLGANNNKFSLRLRKSEGKLLWKYETGSNDYPFMSGDKFDYLTAIMRDTNKQTLFSGTTEPTSGNGYRQDTACTYSENGFAIGGYSKDGVDNLFVGTIKSFRQYDHALEPADVAQNRAVDNWRFFGIPDVTNVIVQSTVPYLRGDEPDGPYAVDGSHVFTAPASVTAKGITYECDGYTVEEWDGSTWTNATSYESCSYTYNTSSGLVRLTWKWKATHGLRTAADYSFEDYSQAGLLWNYDGIRNQGGTDADHDSSATTWKNLGSGGSAYDLAFRSGETTTGEWAADGYIFRGGPRFRSGGKVGPLKNFTLQTLIDADIASQTASNTKFSYIMNAYDGYFNLSLVSPSYDGSAASSFCWKAQGDASGNNATFMYFHAKDNKYDYATAIMDYDNKKAMMFPDTTIPTEYEKEGTYGKQRLYTEFGSVSSVSTTGYGLGNRNNNGTEGLVGTLKSFRYYDRVLTEEELVRNRNVDAVRYFGELGVTNVYVVAGGGTQSEEGAYKVEGEWAFTAENIVKDSVTKNVAAYYTEELVNGAWTNKTRHEGATYTYTEGTSPSTVRLTWASQPEAFIMTVR